MPFDLQSRLRLHLQLRFEFQLEKLPMHESRSQVSGRSGVFSSRVTTPSYAPAREATGDAFSITPYGL